MEAQKRQVDKNSRPTRVLSFSLSGEFYGLNILRIQEIITLPPLSKVPSADNYLRGVFNLRGQVIPVVDLRMKFGIPGKEQDERTCCIIVNGTVGERRIAVGMIVDQVLDVLDFDPSALQATPQYGSGIDAPRIAGLGRSNDYVVMILDIDRVLAQIEPALNYALQS